MDLPLAGGIHWFLCSLERNAQHGNDCEKASQPRQLGGERIRKKASVPLQSGVFSPAWPPSIPLVIVCLGYFSAFTALGRQSCMQGQGEGARMCPPWENISPPLSGYALITAEAPRAPVLFCIPSPRTHQPNASQLGHSPSQDTAPSPLAELRSQGRFHGCKRPAAQMGVPDLGAPSQ